MDEKKASQILTVLLVSAMGPYVLPQMGIRVEHFVMYALVAFFSLKSGLGFLVGKDKHVFMIVVLFLSLLLWFIITTFLFGSNPSINKVLADIDNYTQPIWQILITSYCIRNLKTDESINVLIKAIKTIVVLLGINTVISISSIFYGTWYLEYFNVAGEGQVGGDVFETVLEGAASQGRFTGIFNQPFEAGVAYGVCLISVIFLLILERKLSSRLISPVFLKLGFVSTVLGGVLSVSKVFFPLSVFISFIFFVVSSKGFSKMLFSKTFLRSLFSSLIILFVVSYFLLGQWAGLDYFLRLVNLGKDYAQEGDLLELFTAGRFATSSAGTSVVSDRLNDPNLIFGYGLGSIQTPDSGYLELLYFGGVFGILIYLSILCAIFYFSIKGLFYQPALAKYLASMLVFIVFSNLGAPVFGINRSNFFILIPMIIGVHVLALSGRSHNFSRTKTPIVQPKLIS